MKLNAQRQGSSMRLWVLVAHFILHILYTVKIPNKGHISKRVFIFIDLGFTYTLSEFFYKSTCTVPVQKGKNVYCLVQI